MYCKQENIQRGLALIIDIWLSGGAKTNLVDGIGAPTSSLASVECQAEEHLSGPVGKKISAVTDSLYKVLVSCWVGYRGQQLSFDIYGI